MEMVVTSFVEGKYIRVEFGQFVTGCSNCRKDGPHRGSLFVNFKLHNAHLRSGPLYKNFQKKLIHEEIRNKSSQKRIILNKQSLNLSQLQASTSWIDFKHFENLIFKSNDFKIKGVK